MVETYQRNSTLHEAELGDEIVALDELRGLCFGLSPVASEIWRLLEKPRTLDELVESLLEIYDVDEPECRRDVGLLLSSLQQEELISSQPA